MGFSNFYNPFDTWKRQEAHARKRKGALDCNPSGYHDCHLLDDHACCCFYVEEIPNKRRRLVKIFDFKRRLCRARIFSWLLFGIPSR